MALKGLRLSRARLTNKVGFGARTTPWSLATRRLGATSSCLVLTFICVCLTSRGVAGRDASRGSRRRLLLATSVRRRLTKSDR